MKIDELSIVFPCDIKRVPLFLNTLKRYMEFGIPDRVEFVLVSRTFGNLVIPGVDIKVIKYEYEGEYFCPSLAYNLGVKNSKYKNIIIGHPEVMPLNNVLNSLYTMERGEYVCRVFDLDRNGNPLYTLIGKGFRDEWPGLYFLACYRRESIEAINGWDMRFMNGYSNEDIDFGQRLKNAGIEETILEDLMGGHQYHDRGTDDCDGYKHNRALYQENKDGKVTYAQNGLREI